MAAAAEVRTYLGRSQEEGCQRQRWYESSRRPLRMQVTCSVRNSHSGSWYSGAWVPSASYVHQPWYTLHAGGSGTTLTALLLLLLGGAVVVATAGAADRKSVV